MMFITCVLCHWRTKEMELPEDGFVYTSLRLRVWFTIPKVNL